MRSEIHTRSEDVEPDFGFTTHTEEDVTTSDVTAELIDGLRADKKKLFDIIMPLLNQLIATEKEPLIKWPNRGKILKVKIQEIEQIMKDNNGV